jgi:hypothetical protein
MFKKKFGDKFAEKCGAGCEPSVVKTVGEKVGA